ncbi:MAG: phosphatidylserine decarboxylase family protein [Deltaproteobacteria bacterium]|jgi:phosphatidylserine decarboxylase|nr:phosphatidylserine decarboxylase family protein [Deltaproteobacteria bacterium]MCL5879396.1 phosphatidylserine decarboxylase family protein [Deltaproteobacteria bacterium]MDA8304411.1 phosphatidylserine decarboxylase family protein [Deltaproteobacteria bacterium]
MKYIAKEGVSFIIISLSVSFVFFILYFYLTGETLKYIFLSLSFIFFILYIFNIYFFRDPERKTDLKEDEIVCPADGRVIFLQKVFDDRFLNREAVKLSIFMSLFDVHVNRAPVNGKVEKIIYNKGRFFSANLDKASLENEFNGIILNSNISGGRIAKIAFVQIAGLVARRIVCTIKEGDEITAGERFGLIKYGSRLDLYLPLDFKSYVRINDRVFSGKTVLGRLE